MGGKKKAASGDPAKGEKVFKNLCGVCHSLSVSLFYYKSVINDYFVLPQANSTGPALGGIGNANIASNEGFSYSSALSSKATLKWSSGNLDRWLKSPSSFAPGNAMAFGGIASVKDRQDLIAFLMG